VRISAREVAEDMGLSGVSRATNVLSRASRRSRRETCSPASLYRARAALANSLSHACLRRPPIAKAPRRRSAANYDTCQTTSRSSPDPQSLLEQGLAEAWRERRRHTVERMPSDSQSHNDVWALGPDRSPEESRSRAVLRVGPLRRRQRAASFQPMAGAVLILEFARR